MHVSHPEREGHETAQIAAKTAVEPAHGSI